MMAHAYRLTKKHANTHRRHAHARSHYKKKLHKGHWDTHACHAPALALRHTTPARVSGEHAAPTVSPLAIPAHRTGHAGCNMRPLRPSALSWALPCALDLNTTTPRRFVKPSVRSCSTPGIVQRVATAPESWLRSAWPRLRLPKPTPSEF